MSIMRKLNINFLNYFTAFLMALLLPLSACDDDDDAEPSNGDGDDNGGNNGVEKWEPYDFQDHTSATMTYEFEFQDDGENVLSGTSTIEIEDPAVTVTIITNGEESVFSSNSHDNIEDNFSQVVNQSPYLGGILFGGSYPLIFDDQELYVGASWSMNFDNNSIDLEITGKETYAGVEGYLAEYTFENEEGRIATYDICVNPEVPLPLMIEMQEEQDYYHLVMTNYEN